MPAFKSIHGNHERNPAIEMILWKLDFPGSYCPGANKYADEEGAAELSEDHNSVVEGIRIAVHRKMRPLGNELL